MKYTYHKPDVTLIDFMMDVNYNKTIDSSNIKGEITDGMNILLWDLTSKSLIAMYLRKSRILKSTIPIDELGKLVGFDRYNNPSFVCCLGEPFLTDIGNN